MAYLHRLSLAVAVIALALLVLLPFPAEAVIPAGRDVWYCTNSSDGLGERPGRCGACGLQTADPIGHNYNFCKDPTSGVLIGQEYAITDPEYCPPNSTASGANCVCNAGFEEKDGQCKPVNPCPAGQHEEGGACVPDACEPDEKRVNGICVKDPPCPAGQVRVNGKCEPDKCPRKGTPAGDGWSMSSPATEYACESTGVSFEGSVQYCLIKVVNNFDINYNGKTHYYGSGTYTGAQCSGGSGGGDGDSDPGDGDDGDGGDGDPPNPDDPPKPPDPKPQDPQPPTRPNPDSPPPPPPPPVPPNPDGHCPDGTQRYSNGRCYAPTPDPQPPDENGMCPAGTVKVNGVCVSPSPPGEPVPEPPDEDGGCPDGWHAAPSGPACIKDPEPPTGGKCPVGFTLNSAGLCEWSGSLDPPGKPGGDGDGDGDGDKGFAGSCMAGFACEGDAIFCAIAKEQHKRACKLFDDKSPESDLYDEHKGKTGDQTKDNPGNETINIAGRIDSSDALGGGACIGDLNITVWGTSVNLPLTKLCPVLAMLGNLLVAVSMLVALRIITRG